MNARQIYHAIREAAKNQDKKALKRALAFAPISTPQFVDGNYFSSPLTQAAYEKDEKAIRFLYQNGGNPKDVVKGLLMAGEDYENVFKLLKKLKIKNDFKTSFSLNGIYAIECIVQAFKGQTLNPRRGASYDSDEVMVAFALGGHVGKVNALIKNAEYDKDHQILLAIRGYAMANTDQSIAEAYKLYERLRSMYDLGLAELCRSFALTGNTDQLKALLARMGNDEQREMLIQSAVYLLKDYGNFYAINFLIEQIAQKPTKMLAGEKETESTSLNNSDVKNIKMTEKGYLQSIPENVPEQLAQIRQQREEHAKTVISEQYEEQKANKKWRIAFVVLSAIFLTPLSLVVSLPLYFRAENNDPVRKLKTTNDEMQAVKRKREDVRIASGALKVKEYDKPKKIDKTDYAKPGERIFLVDKSQYERFKLFQKCDPANLNKEAADLAKKLEESKTKSRVRMMYSR